MTQEQADRLSVLLHNAEKALSEACDVAVSKPSEESMYNKLLRPYLTLGDAFLALAAVCARDGLEYVRD